MQINYRVRKTPRLGLNSDRWVDLIGGQTSTVLAGPGLWLGLFVHNYGLKSIDNNAS